MLIYQPFFVGGIDDVEKAKASAFGAAGTFLFTFLLSMVFMIGGNREELQSSRRTEYGRVSVFDEFDDQLHDPFDEDRRGTFT